MTGVSVEYAAASPLANGGVDAFGRLVVAGGSDAPGCGRDAVAGGNDELDGRDVSGCGGNEELDGRDVSGCGGRDDEAGRDVFVGGNDGGGVGRFGGSAATGCGIDGGDGWVGGLAGGDPVGPDLGTGSPALGTEVFACAAGGFSGGRTVLAFGRASGIGTGVDGRASSGGNAELDGRSTTGVTPVGRASATDTRAPIDSRSFA